MPRPWTGRIDLNLLEMSLALSSTVLITEAATHWSDWQVGWRSLAGLPTVVLRWSRQKRLYLHHYGGRTGPNCTSTYRSVCVEAAGAMQSTSPSTPSRAQYSQRRGCAQKKSTGVRASSGVRHRLRLLRPRCVINKKIILNNKLEGSPRNILKGQ